MAVLVGRSYLGTAVLRVYTHMCIGVGELGELVDERYEFAIRTHHTSTSTAKIWAIAIGASAPSIYELPRQQNTTHESNN